MDIKKTGEYLRELRMREKKSLDEAAQDLDVSKSALAMYERGERIPRDTIKVRIAQYYNTTVQRLFFTANEH